MTSSAPCDDRHAVIDHRFVVTREGRTFFDHPFLVIDDLVVLMSESGIVVDDWRTTGDDISVDVHAAACGHPPESDPSTSCYV